MRRAVPGGNVNAAQAVVVLTPEALTALVKGAVSEALAEQRADPEPAVLDRNGLAKALGCSPSRWIHKAPTAPWRRASVPFPLVRSSLGWGAQTQIKSWVMKDLNLQPMD